MRRLTLYAMNVSETTPETVRSRNYEHSFRNSNNEQNLRRRFRNWRDTP